MIPLASCIIWYLSLSDLTSLSMIISRFIHVAANGIISFFINGWRIFHCICLLYPFICQWTFRSLPCLGYCQLNTGRWDLQPIWIKLAVTGWLLWKQVLRWCLSVTQQPVCRRVNLAGLRWLSLERPAYKVSIWEPGFQDDPHHLLN